MLGDRTFYMLYDMATEKVEEYILLPFLSSLLTNAIIKTVIDFPEEMYPQITYSTGGVIVYLVRWRLHNPLF